MAIVAEVSRWCTLGDRPDPGVIVESIASPGKGTQPPYRWEPLLPSMLPHHSIPPVDRPLTSEDRVTLADARAALERGRPVVFVCPPAPERAGGVWELLGSSSPPVLIVCADEGAAVAWAQSAPPEQR